jgi:hypothetical protein
MSEPDSAPRDEDDVDPRSPLFFLSYAHLEPNKRFIKFYDDLQDNVAELVSRPPGSDPGYMDQSMPPGIRWTPELMRAVGTCQAFVALLSRPYFDSAWCAQEWHAFTQRRVYSHPKRALTNRTAIIPVLWTPLRDEEIPPAVSAVQRFSPRPLPKTDIVTPYNSEGLVGLLLLDNDAYKAVVWRIAQQIADTTYNYRVEPRQFQASELRNVFKEQGA